MPASAPLVAVCQFAPQDDRAQNRRRIAELVAEAARRGARVIVLPEYSSFFVDPMDRSLAVNAEALDGEFVQALQRLAAEHGAVIVAGLVERADAGRVRNTLVAVSDAGVQAVYRKQHLYDAFGQTESDWIEPGNTGQTSVFEADGIRFGMMTCYDLRFPEVARTLIDAGADALIVPAEWVRGALKEHHWSTLLTARAIESTAYVIAADHPAPIGVGLSQVIDPQGVAVAGVSSGEGIAVAPLDPALLARTREVNPVLRLRRYRVVPRD
ncbi:carbon-nitrogen hydrolase family protein [Microbacterium sp. ARD32]|uniref:carbon-nitrogen hydrolase family protein n=1 Tax=Microbacterium sp. ARD32 TaxID=2962577 RepID=UPI00288167F5|nr:carbon-nitrogen hydrolase family protein [Microbacterium sp. ARD32]MDT0156726.1 carbon-nitrogen hydrolase family protein [Microbacterium sp. ARD32]